jgi:hypothetical protein
MAEYISREAVLQKFLERGSGYINMLTMKTMIDEIPAADVQPVKSCRMIPLEPDCRGYTDVFICTNCHQHIHLGFIRKEYSGSYCLECGAEVKDGDTE